MSNKKRLKKNPEDENINYDSDDVSNSENEYSDTERRLLEKVRKKRTIENFDSEDEVYGLQDEIEENDDEEDEKDSMASDIEGLQQDDDDLPDERAWGKKKRAFYSTDYVDPDYASASHKDLADAEMEEKEARNIQKRLAEQLDDADFGLDLIENERKDDSDVDDNEIIKTDLSALSKRQKQALMQKESPEFQALVDDFKERMNEAKNILAPFLYLVEKGKCPNCLAVNFIKTKYQLILNYCVNITFYLTLKAKKISVSSHPIIKRLAQYRKLLSQLEEGQGKLLIEIEEILEAEKNGKPLYNIANNEDINREIILPSKKIKSNKFEIEPKDSQTEIMEEELIEDEELSKNENSEEDEEKDEEEEEEIETQGEDERRAITYQISKNKGLTPYRKKELRNPRVKHRNKYRKAKIRRKGAVREVRKELTRYDGEISGIKASVKKSIKLK